MKYSDEFPPYINTLILVPVLIYIIGIGAASNASPDPTTIYLIILFLILGVAAVGYAFKLQLRALKRSLPLRARNQIIFVCSSFGLPALATIIGNWHGQVSFTETPMYGLDTFLVEGLTMSLFCLIASLHLCTISNQILLVHNKINPLIKIFGKIIMGISWLIIFALSYIAYGLSYSAHDPNTE